MDGEGMRAAEERPRVAVLVLHGVGQQAKFETLSAFAAGLVETAVTAKALGAPPKLSRTPLLIGDKVESALTVALPEADLDLIEYYYQPLMQRRVAMSDVGRWLAETSGHIRWLYRKYRFDSQGAEGQDARPLVDNDFLAIHYMLRQPGAGLAFVVHLLSRLVRFLDSLRRVPGVPLLTIPLGWLLGRFADPLLRELAGDVILYTAYDPKLALAPVRDEVLGGCVERIAKLVRCGREGRPPRYRKVFVAGHSLGSVVAYDALSRIALAADHAEETGAKAEAALTRDETDRIGGLVTFGSPLDKIAFMFWPRLEGEDPDEAGSPEWRARRFDIRKRLLKHFHGIRSLNRLLGVPEEEQDGRGPEKTFARLPWLNVHHPQDLIAGHLDAFEGVTNLPIPDAPVDHFLAARRTAEAHGTYWWHPTVHRWLLDNIREAAAPTPPALTQAERQPVT